MTHKAIAHNLLTVAQPVPEQRKDHSFAQFGSALLLLSPPSSEGAKKSLTPCKHCSATTKTCVLSALSSSYTHNTASYQLLGRRLTPSQPKTKTCSFTTKTISLFLAQQSHSIQFLLRTLQNNPLTFHKISSYSHYFSFTKKKKALLDPEVQEINALDQCCLKTKANVLSTQVPFGPPPQFLPVLLTEPSPTITKFNFNASGSCEHTQD